MNKQSIPLFDLKLSTEVKRRVREVLDSGWLNTGAVARDFENKISRLCHCRYAAAVNSATSGLQLSLEALGIEKGAEVVTTPFTFVATVAVILRAGAKPVLADIDPATLTIDPDEVIRKMTGKTRAVVPVDIAGLPADYSRLTRICDSRKVPIIADAAHSLGAGIGRKSVAQLADAAVYSFQATKNLTTGDGGMVVSRHKQFIERVRLLSQHAMTSSAFQRKGTPRWEYDVPALGQKANLLDLNAAVGLGQIATFERTQARRARLAARYSRNLSDLSDILVTPSIPDRYRHAWHLYIVRFRLSRLKISRNDIIALMAKADIECGVHYKPLFRMSFYRQLGLRAQHYPNAAYCGNRVMSLPLYPTLKNSQVDRVCEALHDIIRHHRR